jgi:hypothetical protein
MFVWLFLFAFAFSVFIVLAPIIVWQFFFSEVDKQYKIVCCVSFLVMLPLIYLVKADEENASIRLQEEKNKWVAERCPVYKSVCGSGKRGYECERKAAVVGRNSVGDHFVEAYPTC